MSLLVVDASVLLPLVFGQHTRHAAAREVMGRARDIWCAPDWILAECANTLWKYAHSGRTTPRHAREALRAIHRAPVDMRPTEPMAEAALALALELDHPVYDCYYLVLAAAEDTRVVTDDGRFLAAVASTRWAPHVCRPEDVG